SASFSPAPFAAVQATAVGPGGTFSNGALAFLTYYYTIDGPNNGQQVAVDITTDLLATITNATDLGFASLIDTEGHQLCVQLGSIGCNGVGTLNGGELTEMETPGQVYSIGLEVEASENGAFGGSAFASADPKITVDEALTLDPELYTIRLSDGVANGLPPGTTPLEGAPEPADWALMLLGFAALGGALRSRRRVVGLAAVAA
ncbi:MAG TPA: PEPxxWA-CTERM sorting domain-containing protein, partial [Phenylobacterium sp.]|nr:PEPxxWA-CTERM sorting domain-containing protein [Phenylobacterium sp.]